jgi:soluble lytic murein transglycosylase
VVDLGLAGPALRRALPVVLFAIAATVGASIGWGRASAPDLSAYDADIERVAKEFRLDPNLLRGMVAAESGGDPKARSAAGARGLLQLRPATAREQAGRLGLAWPGDDALDDPATNLRLGGAYLASLLERFDGLEPFAVAAYNAGPENVKRWRLRAADASAREVVLREGFEETRRHLLRVEHFREVYRRR